MDTPPHRSLQASGDTEQTTFTLCVDDFCVKYISHDDATHLMDTLTAEYDLTIDWTGALYCGLALYWQYDKGYIDISMPGYVALTLFHEKK